jgi:hypothetical protein
VSVFCVDENKVNSSMQEYNTGTIINNTSSDKKNVLNQTREEILRIPGKGNKILFISKARLKDNIIRFIYSFIDIGSTTSLCTAEYVKTFNLVTYRSSLPMSMTGMFSSSSEKRKDEYYYITLIKLNWDDSNSIVFPVYVVDSIPHGADILIGLDQVGKSLGLNIPLDKKTSLSFKNSLGKEVILELEEDSIGRIVSNLHLLASENEDGNKTTEELSNEIPSGGKSRVSETNILLKSSSGVEEKRILASSTEQLVQEARIPALKPKLILESVNANFTEEKSNSFLLFKEMEADQIRLALSKLNEELKNIAQLESELLATKTDKGNGIRKTRRAIKSKIEKFRPREEIILLIENLSIELKKIKKKYRKKIANIRKNELRKKRRQENKNLKVLLSKMGRYTLPSQKNQFRSLFKQQTDTFQVEKLTENISFVDQLESIIDQRIDTKNILNTRKNAESLYESIFSVIDEENIEDKIPMSFREEFINTTIILAQKRNNKYDEIANQVADWKEMINMEECDASL